jgi:cell division protein FtsN
VASFRDQDRAERYRGILAAAGARARVNAVTLPGGEVWQRVLVGPFASDDEADATARSLEVQGLITFHRLLAE